LLPTPIEELVLHVLAKARELQSSNRFPNYDFERHTGNLAVVRNPAFFIEPITEANKHKLIDFNIARKARYDRYTVREEAFNNRSHIHFLNTITPTQCSSSSADDAAERARRGTVQSSGQLLPQTPIRGTSPMLGNFTSMSSPGGLGNLSYGGGSIPQLNTQYSLQNTMSNSSSSGGGSMGHDIRVYKPPFMATFTIESLDAFVSATITNLAASKHCPINQWIPLNTDTRENMYWQFFGRQLVTDEADAL